jgi:hypothetical protein
MPCGYIWFYRRDARINFREGSFGWKLKVLVHFLRARRELALLHVIFPPNTSNKNFEIAISLKIVQRSDKKSSGVDNPPPSVRGQALQVMPWRHIWFL